MFAPIYEQTLTKPFTFALERDSCFHYVAKIQFPSFRNNASDNGILSSTLCWRESTIVLYDGDTIHVTPVLKTDVQFCLIPVSVRM